MTVKETEYQEFVITIRVDTKALRENARMNSSVGSDEETSLEDIIQSEISLDSSMSIQNVCNTSDTVNIACDIYDAHNYLETCIDNKITDEQIRNVFRRISNKGLLNDDVYQTIKTVYQDLYPDN